MIRFLRVLNLAIVERIEVEFREGLTVLTGETGAGKSIVLGALELLAGGRATGGLIRDGADSAVVEAALETDDDREIVIRREVAARGRSRVFIDGELATIGALQALGARLIDFHGQHRQQALLDPRTHLPLLDVHGGLAGLAAAVASAHRAWRAAETRLAQARLSGADQAARGELLTFQCREIDEVAPLAGEDETLAGSRTRLASTERLLALCTAAYGALYEQDAAVMARLGHVWRQIEELAAIDPAFAKHLDGRTAIDAQLEDLAFFLRSYAAGIDGSPERLAEVETRLALLERLKKQYGPRLDDVLEHRRRIGAELETLAGHAGEVERRAETEAEARNAFLAIAGRLSERRRRTAAALGAQLAPVLDSLAMPHARVQMRFADAPLPPERWSERGIDEGEIYFSANPGEPPRPLARIASGGELSRVMLGLKTLATTDLPGKTLVFDEVDAGIGGAAADRVGRMLRTLAERFQVLCVTHLPQIAAYAATHQHVSKTVRDGRTTTSLESLGEQGRVAELARLMSGRATRTAQEGARALLAGKRKPEAGASVSRRGSGGKDSVH